MYKRFLKRILDVSVALAALICLSPVIAATALWLWRANGKEGVLFTQLRPGRGGRLFRLYKFKTMTDRCDSLGNLLPDEQRITRAGSMARSLSLDELPQLWNVVRGDMSLIGPRPLLPQYLPLYSPRHARRHDIRPGITGWAQCHGRNALSWTEKFELDIWYVDHMSAAVDMRIILLTLRGLIRREGISAPKGTTPEPFNGRN